jgi:hypothetical protein
MGAMPDALSRYVPHPGEPAPIDVEIKLLRRTYRLRVEQPVTPGAAAEKLRDLARQIERDAG